MSSLIARMEESQALVATDTLATTPDGIAFKFTTKAFIVPHLRMIIAGTGFGGFLDKWFVHINTRMIVRGIDNLDYHARRNLAAIWGEEKLPVTDKPTTTVYHFGFSENTERIHSFAYRSTGDFQSEPLGYGLIVKPECTVPPAYSFPADIEGMMAEQRAIQSLTPKSQRVYIGGEIQVHHLTKAGFHTFRLARFEDFERDQESIYERLAKERSAS